MARKGEGIYKRGNVWWLDCRINGTRYQVPLGKGINRKVALELAAIKRTAILRGEAGIAKKKRDVPFQKAVEEFLAAAEANTRPNTVRGYRQHLKEVGNTIGQRQLSEVSPFLIEKHRQRRISEGAPVGFNRELGTLRTMFNWCIDRGRFEGANPTRKVKKIKESRGRERFLEPEEEARLLGACSEPLRTMLMCGIYAGLRIPSEVLSLKKTYVDIKRGFLTIEGAFAKNGKTETIPLNPKLREALAGIMAKPNRSEFVFVRENGNPYKSIQNIFRKAVDKAGLSNLTPHAMRHTFASRLGEMGCDIRTIQELGRWADIRMVQRYDNVSERRKKEAVASLSGHFTTKFTNQQTPDQTTNQALKTVNSGK